MNEARARRARAFPLHALFAFALVAGSSGPGHCQNPFGDPLPSWNDGAPKRAIVEFVQAVTTEGGRDFVPVEERIAAFDNDGTLWMEKPLPTEVYFVLARVGQLAQADPSLRQKQPFRAALEGDTAYFRTAGAQAVAELLLETHGGMTQEFFANEVRSFLASSRHPALHRPFTETAYAPMLELLDYLRANGFQCWISSGGTADFVRVFAPDVYDVPPERTIGTDIKLQAKRTPEGWVVLRLPEIVHLNDKDGKVVGIDSQIGRRPILVAGNVLSGGDVAMMEYSKQGRRRSLQLLVNHDDAAREAAYAEKDGASLAAAHASGFTVVSMKTDWNRVFAADGPPPKNVQE